MEIKITTDVYNNLDYTYAKSGREPDAAAANAEICSEPVAAVYERSEPSELSAYSAD